MDIMLLRLPEDQMTGWVSETCDFGETITALGSEVMYDSETSKCLQLLFMCCLVDYKITWIPWQIYLNSGLTAVTNGPLDLGM
jgi:hypothetical protein